MSSRQILVYVQALPVSTPTSAKKFQDLEVCEFRMSQSSKSALALARKLGFHEIMAVGFSSILREAVARGATSCHSVPLCDDPLEQASFFPKEQFSHLVIAENSDWVFTGSSLAGILSESLKMHLRVFTQGNSLAFPESSIILVKDSGVNSESMDVRRIRNSFDVPVDPEGVLGSSSLTRREIGKSELLSGDTSEIASVLARKLKRLTPR
ncbi:MAG: hypothetical protein JRN67_10670 [Nitrososphaerota archaeon]|nr:hypothetical protein [Nitrososphaerota archaeon]